VRCQEEQEDAILAVKLGNKKLVFFQPFTADTTQSLKVFHRYQVLNFNDFVF